MVEPLRHRQTKGAETDMPSLPPPRHIPTLPVAVSRGPCRESLLRGMSRHRRLNPSNNPDGLTAVVRRRFSERFCSTLLAEGAINYARYAVYIAACAILWRTIARKTPYCRANAASFAPTEPTEMNQAQVAKSKRRAMNRLASPSAASKAAQA